MLVLPIFNSFMAEVFTEQINELVSIWRELRHEKANERCGERRKNMQKSAKVSIFKIYKLNFEHF